MLLDWSEVWALFIPIIALARNKKQPPFLYPVIAYIFIALYLNIIADVIWKYQNLLHFPIWFRTNTYVYHVNSIVRFFLFSLFFIKLNQPFLYWIKRIIPIIFLGFVIINFNYFDKFVNYWWADGYVNSKLSNHLLAVEASFLLFYCLQYYLFRLQEDHEEIKKPPHFWIVTGLCIFVVASFPIDLFYDKLVEEHSVFATVIWKVPNISLIIFCILIAKAFSTSKN